MTTEYATSVPNDAELITAARAGADESYAELYRRHEDAARAAARCVSSSAAEAEVLVTDAFTRVLQSLRAGKGPEIAFRPYLLSAVRVAAEDRDARAAGDTDAPSALLEELNAGLIAKADTGGDRDAVAVAFANLPERWQVVLWHMEVEGRPAAEVAPLLGLDATAVASLSFRAKEGFRQAYLQAQLHDLAPGACSECRPKLGAYVRDGLSPRERTKVEEHLDECGTCRALLAELDAAGRRLRGVLVPLVLGLPGGAYLAALRGGRGLIGVLHRAGRGTRLAAALVAAAAVIAFALFGASALNRASLPRDEQADPPPEPTAVDADTTDGDGSSRSSTTIDASPTATATSVASAGPDPISATPLVPPSARPTVAPIPIRPLPPATAPRRAPQPSPTIGTVPLPTPSTTSSTSTTTPATSSTVDTGLPPVPGLAVSASSGGPFVAGQFGYVDVSVVNVAGDAGGGPGTRRAPAAAGPAADVVVTMELPAGLGFSSVDGQDWECVADVGTLTCTLPDLAAGAKSDARVELALDDSLTGQLDLTPSIRAGDREAREGPTLGVAVRAAGDLAYVRVLRGGVTAIGNTSMTCVDPEAGCVEAQQGTAAGDANLRQSHVMDMVGGDAAAGVLNRSSAGLALPAGASVENALLVWAGDLAAGDGGVPAPGDPASVELAGPGGSATVAAAVVRTAPDDPAVYEASADVTALVAGGGTYTVSGVQAGTGVGQFAGWTLLVAYRDPAAPPALIALADRWSTLGTTATVVSVDGLAPVAGDRTVGVVWAAQEGDLTLADEAVQVNGVAVADSRGDPGDLFNSSIDGNRSPAFLNNFGIDVDRVGATVPGSATTVSLSAVSTRDRSRLGPVGFVVSV